MVETDQKSRVLFISPTDVTVNNGMLQRQVQFLKELSSRYPNRLDVLALASSPAKVEDWLSRLGIQARVVGGPFAALARMNTWLWYAVNVMLCNRVRIINNFRFFIRTPLPKVLGKRYAVILCYYPWAHVLLGLNRFGPKVIVDLGDVMGDRHQRIGIRRWISLSPECERQILNSGSRCVAISFDDRNEFNHLYDVTLPVVPFIPPEHANLRSVGTPLDSRAIGYFGARSYQNEEILRSICSERFLVSLEPKGWTLVLAGGICSALQEEERARVLGYGGKILGRVADPREFYRQVGIILNPVGPSTGVKIKSVEALFAQRRLVTTSFGADEGLRQDFSDQITLIDWPLDPERLAKEAMRGAEGSTDTTGTQGFEAYIHRTNHAFDAMLEL